MTDRERLIELLDKTFAEQYEKRGFLTAPHTADYLLANGTKEEAEKALKERDGK